MNVGDKVTVRCMIDTVKLRSPFVSEEVARSVELGLTRRIAFQERTDTVLYEIVSESLAGTYDARLSVALKREEIITTGMSATYAGRRRPVTQLRSCDPYLVIECSIHKQIVGHNICSGPREFTPACRWLIGHLERVLGITGLPDGASWYVERVDVTECYEMSFEAIQEFIRSLNNATFPRRAGSLSRYGSHGIFSGGSSTSLKLYHKGPEFAKHDAPRLRTLWDRPRVYNLQVLANGIMRVEVGIKQEKLKRDFGKRPTVDQVTDEYLAEIHDTEVAKLLREARTEMGVVRTMEEVTSRLYKVHKPHTAGTLVGLWVQLSTVGEEVARSRYPNRTWYRHRKALVDSGCAWDGTDLALSGTNIPVGFAPVRRDQRRDAVESFEVAAALAPYRLAV